MVMKKFRKIIIFVPLLVILGFYGLVKVVFNNEMQTGKSSLTLSPIAIMAQNDNDIDTNDNLTNWEIIKDNYHDSYINSNLLKQTKLQINHLLLESLPNVQLTANQQYLINNFLNQIYEVNQQIYKLVKSHDWNKAKTEINLVKTLEIEEMKFGVINLPLKKLNYKIYLLNKAITNKDTSMAMRNSNQIIFIVAEMKRKFPGKIPGEIYLLNYYERELEIWTPTNNKPWLHKTSQNIHHTWLSIRSLVLARGGAMEADNFDKLLISLDHATLCSDYNRIIPLLQKEQDSLERLFL